MTKDEALKLALEALEEAWYHVGTFQPTEKAIDLYDEARTTIKEALVQDALDRKAENARELGLDYEPEPVAWMFQHEETGRIMFVDAQQIEWGFEKGNPRLKKISPVYTTPPQRKPLSWERVLEIGLECANDHSRLPFEVKVARAIEAAHGITGEKNGTR